MSNLKQVKVDNWGIYFLQRLKHFFNRTDYCDLTLQFQDNAQLKVHRLVLSACTEYFELLERTCEMYEDCLVMPDDLQADVVVPIVNFMYTGQLEFKMELLESLYQTSQIMNMPVLTKLLDAHRVNAQTTKPVLNYNVNKRSYSKNTEPAKQKQPQPIASSSKRSYSKAFASATSLPQTEKKQHHSSKTSESTNNGFAYHSPSITESLPTSTPKKAALGEPRPTRYELPEELDSDNVFDNSFTNISYASQPLMVHPETRKSYQSKKSNVFNEASSSSKFGNTSTVDIVECKKITRKDTIFDDDDGMSEEPEIFHTTHKISKEETKVSNQLFDQIMDIDGPKVTIETRDNKQANNIDHAKIISEVLKKYPHLVKSNKNIKLRILNTPATTNKSKRQRTSPPLYQEGKVKTETPDFTYETDVIDSKEAARLIALGAENVKGPWICLICGTPGRALHFTSYYKFRRHLVEVHNEKPISKICEYCGLKSLKRNYLLHHLYTKHGVEPPPSYHFPKCNLCNYIALTEGFLVKHKLSHTESRSFRCNVCASTYNTSSQLLAHIQTTGHKYSADRKTNLQCIYCLKVFLRESNLYAHLKTNHKELAKSDGIIEESDEEKQEEHTIRTESVKPPVIKYEPQSYDNEYEDMDNQYQIQQRPDGNIELISKKHIITTSPTKQKILNTGLTTTVTKITPKPKPVAKPLNNKYGYLQDVSISNKSHDEIVMIDDTEYIMRDNRLIPRKKTIPCDDYIIPEDSNNSLTSTPMEFSNIHESITNEDLQEQKLMIKKSANINQPIQIVVSNEEEYKALMNSNHSIIFDDGDANKTLTVLSTPHNATLSTTTIDLDNTQSGDMMIIPENYPLNVSEHLPHDNSNIVVVYSHSVDEQNKQYQLISPQDIGAQFVQSSAVITQNYETITTSTPVMSAHVIDTQEADSWQNNVEENLDNQEASIVPQAEIQEMTVVDHTEIPPTESVTNNLNELPEVTLSCAIPQQPDIEETSISENLTHPNTINSDMMNQNLEQVIEGDIQNASATAMDVDASTEIAIEGNVDDKPIEVSAPCESLLQNETNIEQANINEQQLIDESTVIEQGVEIEKGSEQLCEENQSQSVQLIDNVTEDNTEDISHLQEEVNTAQVESQNSEEVPVPNVVKEQIQNLASEWSEDEDEAEPQNPSTIEEKVSNDDSENIAPTTENISNEVEESVQMDKQINTETDTQENVNTTQDDKMTILQEEPQPHTILAAEAPQEKISSLLNDWEDNDSQEESESVNTNEEVATEAADSTDIPLVTEVDKHEQKSDDKIKSLVSDWDDDEDDNKT